MVTRLGKRGTSRALATVVCTVFVSSCQPSADSAMPPELWSNFTDKPDSDTLPATFDSGQQATVGFDQPTAAPFIKDGSYTFNPLGTGRGASYYQGKLANVVRHIKVRFSFKPGTTDGGVMAVAILNAQQLENSIPSMSAHLTVGPNDWNYGVWDGVNNGNTKLHSIGYGAFRPPLVLDPQVVHEVELSIDESRALLSIDGKQMPAIEDRRIDDPTYGGPFVFFECFTSIAATDNIAQFRNILASSDKQ